MNTEKSELDAQGNGIIADVIKPLPSDGDIEKEAEVYATNLDFSNDSQLNEKGRQRVAEWCKQDFVAGAKYMRGLAEGNVL